MFVNLEETDFTYNIRDTLLIKNEIFLKSGTFSNLKKERKRKAATNSVTH